MRTKNWLRLPPAQSLRQRLAAVRMKSEPLSVSDQDPLRFGPLGPLASPDSPLGWSLWQLLHMTSFLIVRRLCTCGSPGLKHLSQPALLCPASSCLPLLCLVRACSWLGCHPGATGGATAAFCTGLAMAACLSEFSTYQLPKEKDWAILIVVLSPVPDPELLLNKYLLEDTDLGRLDPSKQAGQLWYEGLTHSDSLRRAEVRPKILLKLQKWGGPTGPVHTPLTPAPSQPTRQEQNSEKPNANPKAHSKNLRLLQL